MSPQSKGTHVIADFSACGPGAGDVDGTLQAMREAVEVMGATLLQLNSHGFSPHGHTALALLSESHLAVHSWPETGYVAVDAFTCGHAVRPEAGVEVLREFFQPQHVAIHRIARGEVQLTKSADIVEKIEFRDLNQFR